MKPSIHAINMLLTLCTLFIAHDSNAATYTSVGNGNWSDATNWIGGAMPGSYIHNDTVVIAAASSVTLDVDVQFNGPYAVLIVEAGNLLRQNNGPDYLTKLTLNDGAIIGNSGSMATIHLFEMEISGNAVLALDDHATILAEKLRFNTSGDISLTTNVTVTDSVFFTSGKVILLQGSTFSIENDTWMVMAGGLIEKSGGITYGGDQYNVWYKEITSCITGIEIAYNGFGIANVYIDLINDEQVLTLGAEISEIRDLFQNTGVLDLNGKQADFRGSYVNNSTRGIRGNAASKLIVSTAHLGGNLYFEQGTEQLKSLIFYTDSDSIKLTSDLHIYEELKLGSGTLLIENTVLTMEENTWITVSEGFLARNTTGTFDGSNNYGVKYAGFSTRSTGIEMSGTGLKDVRVDLGLPTRRIALSENYTIPGTLTLGEGILDLNDKTLTLTGNYVRWNENGGIRSTFSSVLNVYLSVASADTFYFVNAGDWMDTLNIDLADGGDVLLGTNLSVNRLNLISGSIVMIDTLIFIQGEPFVPGANANNYVKLTGNAKLGMVLDPATTYTAFPVGTTEAYSPALIRYNSGMQEYFMVNVVSGVYLSGVPQGPNLAEVKSMVNRTWNISSVNASATNFDLKVRWPSELEMNSFDRTQAKLSLFDSGNWDHPLSTVSTAVEGMYEVGRTGVVTFGSFAVVDNFSTLGIKEELTGVSLYPNPTTGLLHVSCEGKAQVELTDIYGKILETVYTKGDETVTLNLALIPAGIYCIKTNTNGVYTTQKVTRI